MNPRGRLGAAFSSAAAALLVASLCAAGDARAEPYLALESGLRCAACHVNRTGGGMRAPVGNRYAQARLAANALPAAEAWSGRIGDYVGVGANLRAAAISDDLSGRRETDPLDLREARAYLELRAIPERLSLYVDHFLGPGGASNREAFVLYSAADGSHHVKAGRIYLPFGWRLEDGSALVRSETGIDMSGPDVGIELGWDPGPWSMQFAVSNGTFGSRRDVDSGKLVSLQAQHIADDWRAGAAANVNDLPGGDRRAVGVFGGWRVGRVVALGELASIDDRSGGGSRRSTAWLLEANTRLAQGHWLKASAEGIEPERSAERQRRLSVVYEYTPIGVAQLRGGVRATAVPRGSPFGDRQIVFVELHAFF